MPKITIKLYEYCAAGRYRDYEVAASVVGDIAVHRPVYWFRNEEPKVSPEGWVVTHIPSGLQITRAMPESYKTRKLMLRWAEEFQRRAADVFATLREGGDLDREAAIAFYHTGKGICLGEDT